MTPEETAAEEYEFRERRMFRRLQPFLRDAATAAGLLSGCTLPKCRRAHRCLGRHPDAEIGRNDRRFPPCVKRNADQSALLAALRKSEAAKLRLLEAEGHSPEDIARICAETARAIKDGDDWPEDPLSDAAKAARAAAKRGARKGR